MKIKEGYNGAEIEIRIAAQENGSIELWLTQNGLPSEVEKYRQTLSYMTADELFKLKEEVTQAARDLYGF
jgi:hypothetical protein